MCLSITGLCKLLSVISIKSWLISGSLSLERLDLFLSFLDLDLLRIEIDLLGDTVDDEEESLLESDDTEALRLRLRLLRGNEKFEESEDPEVSLSSESEWPNKLRTPSTSCLPTPRLDRVECLEGEPGGNVLR